MQRILVPSGAGVGSAIGFLRAPVGLRGGAQPLPALRLLRPRGGERAARRRWRRRRGTVVARGAFGAPVDGAAHRLHALCRPGPRDRGAAAAARPGGGGRGDDPRRSTTRSTPRFYDRPVPGSDVEVMSFAVTVATREEAVDAAAEVPDAPAPAPLRQAAVRDTATGEVAEWPVYDRDGLVVGAPLAGPCIVAEDETSTLVGAGLDVPERTPGLPRSDAGGRHDRFPTRSAKSMSSALADIQRQILWNRLIAVVEEQAQTMIRTAFCTTVREAGDLSAGIFDLQGRMLAQAVTGTPGHVNSMAESVGHFLAKFPSPACSRATTTSPTIPGSAPATCTTSPSSRRPSCGGAHRRPVRQHGARHRHRRARHGAGRAERVRGRALHPDRQVLRPRGAPNETFFDFLRAGTRTPVGAGGRHLLPLRLQRRRARGGSSR